MVDVEAINQTGRRIMYALMGRAPKGVLGCLCAMYCSTMDDYALPRMTYAFEVFHLISLVKIYS